MQKIRFAAVAGAFYPASAPLLQQELEHFLRAVVPTANPAPPKALIVPHAGYQYSGAIAASAYARLLPVRERIRRVVLMGPAHRVFVPGIAMSSAEAFASPLGEVPLESGLAHALSRFPQVQVLDRAHEQEHCLEVHLPFLRYLLKDFSLIPLLVGQSDFYSVAQVLEFLWGGEETLIVVSSDLSHYQDYASAQQRDAATTWAIEHLRPDLIQGEDACGYCPLNALLYAAKRKGLQVETLDVRNSGDTAGNKDRVVGYGAYVLH